MQSLGIFVLILSMKMILLDFLSFWTHKMCDRMCQEDGETNELPNDPNVLSRICHYEGKALNPLRFFACLFWYTGAYITYSFVSTVPIW